MAKAMLAPLLLGLLPCAIMAGLAPSAINAKSSPIDKVVTLISEMKATTEKEAAEDMEAYDKYKCWCITSEKEKTDAIAAAQAKLAELESFLEKAAGKEGELKTAIAGLEEDIAEDTDALASATSMREEENKEFLGEQADMKETLGLLSEAISVLNKVQLVQKSKGPAASQKAAAAALIQVRELARGFKFSPRFSGVMQKDLFDMLGAFQEKGAHRGVSRAGAFLGKSGGSRSLPWLSETEEDKGKAANPNDLEGAAAGAKSYNSRSGGILGILKQMGDQFAADLASAQKEEMQSLIDFQNLKAAKTAEIAAATEQKDSKESALSDLLYAVAKAKKEMEKTQAALSADEAFMLEMTKNCKIEDEAYAGRVKVRTEEIKALAETLEILTGDEARSLFDKTISLIQLRAVRQHVSRASTLQMMQEKAATRAMQRLVQVARKHKSWALASLAVRVKLDAFTKVKEAMDKMMAELKMQQKEEYDKNELCLKEFDETEDKIKVATNTKEDLGEKHTELSNTISTLTNQIKELEKEVADAQVSLKEAGEQRKSENQLYQTTMNDQRATITVLNMAKDRLKEFYTPKAAALVSVQQRSAVAPPPPKPAGYEKSEMSGGVMQLLAKIISDAESTEIEIKMGEQKSQEEYATFVAATTASIDADREAIAEAEEQKASATGSKSETEESQLANGAELTKLEELLAATHQDCDYVVKYFDMRQKARAEEMDAIEEAKAILSGASFS